MSGFYQDGVQDDLLDLVFGAAAGPTPPGTYYVALFTTMPASDGTGGVEASYTAYARFPVTNDLTEFPAAAAGSKANANDWDFGVAGSGPTTIVGFGFYDDPTSVLPVHLWAAVTVTGGSVVINNGADVKFLAGAVTLQGC